MTLSGPPSEAGANELLRYIAQFQRLAGSVRVTLGSEWLPTCATGGEVTQRR
ncbi:MAG: hypothetical protein WCF36_17230 [Candidatus Nanopelagicales bacterium]